MSECMRGELGQTARLWLCAALVLASCKHGASAPAEPAAKASPRAAAPASAGAAAAPAPVSPASVSQPLPAVSSGAGCRVMSLTGTGTLGSGHPLHAGDRLTGSDWIELVAGARLHLEHTTSTRQWTVQGPARLVPCVEGGEEIVLSRGTLATELAAGVRPGAQVVIGTPFGTLRYADARAELRVSPAELSVKLSAGEAWLGALPRESPELHLTPRQALRRGAEQRWGVSPALGSCAAAANDAQAQARALIERSSASLGERAKRHVQARELARARCASAAAAVLQQSQGEALVDEQEHLASYRALWQQIPGAG